MDESGGGVGKLREGLWQTVDPEIRALVVALRAHGLPTSSSCGGHLECQAMPYVGFYHVPTGPEFEPVIDVPLYVNHLIRCLDELLGHFYRDRKPPGRERLMVTPPHTRSIILLSVGAWEGDISNPGDEGRLLGHSRDEMRRFADFLRANLLSEGPIMKRRRRSEMLDVLERN